MLQAVLISSALYLLLILACLMVTISEPRPAPPTIAVASPASSAEREAPAAAPKPVAATAAAASSMAPTVVSPVTTAVAVSSFRMSLPELPSAELGSAGLDRLGPSFGSGLDGATMGGGGIQRKVGRITVKAQRLGVVLDVSGSMQALLPGVRKELREAFKSAKIVEVEGCALRWEEPKEEAEENGEHRRRRRRSESRPRLRNSADSVIEAVEMLVVAGRIDALYWFSDLQDGENQGGLDRLSELLNLEAGKDKAVRLYIRSLERPPSRKLALIARASGGAVQVGDRED